MTVDYMRYIADSLGLKEISSNGQTTVTAHLWRDTIWLGYCCIELLPGTADAAIYIYPRIHNRFDKYGAIPAWLDIVSKLPACIVVDGKSAATLSFLRENHK